MKTQNEELIRQMTNYAEMLFMKYDYQEAEVLYILNDQYEATIEEMHAAIDTIIAADD